MTRVRPAHSQHPVRTRGGRVQGRERVPVFCRSRIKRLLELGIIERVGRGRGVRSLPSRKFYRHIGKAGLRAQAWFVREANRELLLKHNQDNQDDGNRLGELVQMLPAFSRVQLQDLLWSLKQEGRVHKVGRTKAARWYPGRPSSSIASEKSNLPKGTINCTIGAIQFS